ncbi:MAG: hypothetical protein J6K28_06745 [Alistipes sp.]|nr:hypothetical protein [Alistipes sp.]
MKEFDFNEVGRRMPYSVPEGFFEKAEQNAYAAIADGTARHRPRIMRSTMAIASAATVFIGATVLGIHTFRDRQTVTDPQQQYCLLLTEVSDNTVEEISANYMEDYNDL